MSESKLRELSLEFAVDIIELVKYLKANKESIISNQIGKSIFFVPIDKKPVTYGFYVTGFFYIYIALSLVLVYNLLTIFLRLKG